MNTVAAGLSGKVMFTVLACDGVGSDVTFGSDVSDIRYYQMPAGWAAASPGSTGFVRRVAALRATLAAVKPDLLWSNLSPSNHLVATALKLIQPDTRVLLRFGNPLKPELAKRAMLKRELIRRMLRVADGLLANAMSNDVADCLGVPGDHVTFIPNPVDVARVSDLAATRLMAAPKGQPTILAVGRLTDQKDHALLLRAFAILVQKQPAAALWLVGDGPLRSDLESSARQLGLGSSVHFLGWQQNPYPFMAAADAVVLTSRFEGTPNVVLEAFCCGSRVVAVDCPWGIREVLANGDAGEIVNSRDPREVAEAIDRSLGRSKASTADAVQRQLKRHSQSVVCDQYLALFKAVHNARQQQPA